MNRWAIVWTPNLLVAMPVLSTTYYSGYPSSNSSLSRNSSSGSTFSSLRSYSGTSLSSKSRSSYDLTAYRPSNYLSTHSTSTSSYKSPSSLLSTNNTSNYYSNRYSTGISGNNYFAFLLQFLSTFLNFKPSIYNCVLNNKIIEKITQFIYINYFSFIFSYHWKYFLYLFKVLS